MSNLRIIGLIIGSIGLFLTFRIFRGPKWRKSNFLFFGLISLAFVLISAFPNILDAVTGMLTLEQEARGRILTLLIFSNIISWFFVLYLKTRIDSDHYQFDLLIRNLGQKGIHQQIKEKIENKAVTVIIPAYNEAKSLKTLLPRIPKKILDIEIEILVISDGSTDNTVELVEEMGYLCISNIINRGQGAASRLGYDVLAKHNVKIGVTMDADGQHQPKDLAKLIQPVLQGRHDLVIGSRVLGQSFQKSRLRLVGIAVFSKIINLLTDLKLTDPTSGFKAFNMQEMKKLMLAEDQFQAAEVIIEASKKGLRIAEVPITIHERRHGQSRKGKNWKYGTHFFRTILKTWWR